MPRWQPTDFLERSWSPQRHSPTGQISAAYRSKTVDDTEAKQTSQYEMGGFPPKKIPMTRLETVHWPTQRKITITRRMRHPGFREPGQDNHRRSMVSCR